MSDPQLEKKKSRVDVFDIGALVGLLLVVYGLWMIYRPLAPLVGGLLLVSVCCINGGICSSASTPMAGSRKVRLSTTFTPSRSVPASTRNREKSSWTSHCLVDACS